MMLIRGSTDSTLDKSMKVKWKRITYMALAAKLIMMAHIKSDNTKIFGCMVIARSTSLKVTLNIKMEELKKVSMKRTNMWRTRKRYSCMIFK